MIAVLKINNLMGFLLMGFISFTNAGTEERCRPCVATDPHCTHAGVVSQFWCDSRCPDGVNDPLVCVASHCTCGEEEHVSLCPAPEGEITERVGTAPGECSPNCNNRCCVNQDCQRCYIGPIQECIDQAASTASTSAPETGSTYFTMTGDCDTQGDCVSSSGYPQSHGNSESCSVTMTRDSSVSVGSTFSLETCCDHLIIRDVDVESSSAVPSSLSSGETFSWSSDFSVTREGWKLCFSEPSSSTTSTTQGEDCWENSSDGVDLAPGEWSGDGQTSFEQCKKDAESSGVKYFAWTGQVYNGYCKVLNSEVTSPDLTTNQGYGYQLYEYKCTGASASFEFLKFGGCADGSRWQIMGFPDTLEKAKQMMLNHEVCSQEGSQLFYSSYSYSWGARCAGPNDFDACTQTSDDNPNWETYVLSFPSTHAPTATPTPVPTFSPSNEPSFTPTATPTQPNISWAHIGNGDCSGGWKKIGIANSLAEAKELMLADLDCYQDGAVLFYSAYSSHESWSVRCATAGQHDNYCSRTNENWQKYELTISAPTSTHAPTATPTPVPTFSPSNEPSFTPTATPTQPNCWENSSDGVDLAPGEWSGYGQTSFEQCKKDAETSEVKYFAWTGQVYNGYCKVLNSDVTSPDLTTNQGYGYQLYEYKCTVVSTEIRNGGCDFGGGNSGYLLQHLPGYGDFTACEKLCIERDGCTHFEYCWGSNCQGNCAIGVITDISGATYSYPSVKCYSLVNTDAASCPSGYTGWTSQNNCLEYFYCRNGVLDGNVLECPADHLWIGTASGGHCLPDNEENRQQCEHTAGPTSQPSRDPTSHPSSRPSNNPSTHPSCNPTLVPTTMQPSTWKEPTRAPTRNLSTSPTHVPTSSPSQYPTYEPTRNPLNPTRAPNAGHPTKTPSLPAHIDITFKVISTENNFRINTIITDKIGFLTVCSTTFHPVGCTNVRLWNDLIVVTFQGNQYDVYVVHQEINRNGLVLEGYPPCRVVEESGRTPAHTEANSPTLDTRMWVTVFVIILVVLLAVCLILSCWRNTKAKDIEDGRPSIRDCSLSKAVVSPGLTPGWQQSWEVEEIVAAEETCKKPASPEEGLYVQSSIEGEGFSTPSAPIWGEGEGPTNTTAVE